MTKSAIRPLGLGLLPSFAQLLSEVEQPFSFRQGLGLSTLRTNIVEKDNTYIVTTEAPGVKKEDLSVKFEDDVLTISTQFSDNKETVEGEKVLHQERFFSSQTRSFRFENVDTENIDAKFEDGILTLTLTKKQKENVKTIEIK